MTQSERHPQSHNAEPVAVQARPVAHRYLDTVGLYCPVPIMKTAEAIRRMQIGEVLHVVSDDRIILIDMPAWCRSNGHDLVHTEPMGRQYHLFVRKMERRQRPPLPTD
jgi:TusA-related sulfurtransferase